MEIRTKSENVTNELQYTLTSSKQVEKVSENAGYIGTPTDYIIYQDGDKEVCCIRFEDGKMVGTNSPTFIREIDAMIAAFNKIPRIKIESGTSKAGRTFFIPELA